MTGATARKRQSPESAKPRVTYSRLTPAARAEIQWAGVTVAAYVRHHYPDGQWGGDRCGCPDDRCRDGYHHEPWEDCGCLAALVKEVPT